MSLIKRLLRLLGLIIDPPQPTWLAMCRRIVKREPELFR